MSIRKGIAKSLVVMAAFSMAAGFGGQGSPLSGAALPFFASCEAAASHIDASIRPLQLDVQTHFTVDGDDAGDLLRTSVAQVNFVGSAEAAGVMELQKALWKYDADAMNRGQEIREQMLAIAAQDRAERQAAGANFFAAHESLTDVFVRRADTLAVSLMEFHQSYEGGVHGMYGVTGRNFDAETGQPLSLADVIADKEKLAEAVKAGLRRRYPKASFAEGGSTLMAEMVDQMLRDDVLPWTLDPTGVSFYFNPYLIGSYAEGIFTATVLFDEHPALFAERYRRAPAAWCLELRPYLPARVSFADGSRAEVNITTSDSGLRITMDGAVLNDSGETAGLRPVLVSLADGRRYLYVDSVDAGDTWETLSVFDLNGAAPVRVPMKQRMTRRADVAEDFADMERGEPKNDAYADKSFYIMADPENFRLTLLDAETGQARLVTCRVGADGTPEILR